MTSPQHSPFHPITSLVVISLAIVLSGLSAGFFVTWQVSVIRGLALVDAATYVQTFQSVNNTIRSAAFGLYFFGTTPMIALAVWIFRRQDRVTLLGLAMALILAAATVLITFMGNVPLNNALGVVDPTAPGAAAAARLAFEQPWNTLNLYRTATSLASFACMALVAGRLTVRKA